MYHTTQDLQADNQEASARIIVSIQWLPLLLDKKSYSDRYFSREELISTDSDFSTNAQWHTTLFNCDTLPLKGNLKAIYLQHFPTNDPVNYYIAKDREMHLISAISDALRDSDIHVPVIMRPILCKPVKEEYYSTKSVDSLWDTYDDTDTLPFN